MKCPKCHSHKTHKYGHQIGKQRYKCNECGRQFIEVKTERGYDEKTKLLCLKAMQQGNREGSAVLGVPPETKPDYVEPLWLVGYAEKG